MNFLFISFIVIIQIILVLFINLLYRVLNLFFRSMKFKFHNFVKQ